MKQPTYQQAISSGWQMVWKHKNLWVLGLLAAFLGQFGLSNFFGRLWMLYTQGTISSSSEFALQNLSFSLGVLNWYNILGLVWLSVLMILILVTVVFLSVTAQGALISYSASWYKNKRFTNFKKAWHIAVIHFWPMLKLVVVYKIIFCLLILGAVGVLRYSDVALSNSASVLVGIVLGVILFFHLIFSIIYIYALGYVVVDDNRATEAVKKAWNLFSRHVLVSLEVGVIMTFLSLLLVVVAGVVLVIALIPATIVWITAAILHTSSLAVLGFFVGFVVWLILVVLLASIFNAFNIAVWTYLFIKMHKEGVASRVIHFITKPFRK